MIRTLVAALCLAASTVIAADQDNHLVAGERDGGFFIELTKDKCPDDMIAKLADETKAYNWRRADEMFMGRSIRACWAPNPPVVLIFDEEGDAGAMRMADFRLEQGL